MLREPGNTQDIDQNTLQQWNAHISAVFAQNISDTRQITQPPQARAWIFDPVSEGVAGTAAADISWIAFPKQYPGKYAEVDANRNLQEEYCEWEVSRDSSNNVVRITFTTETEDYYRFLWTHARAKLVELYRHHVDPAVVESDLGIGSPQTYNPANSWNWPSRRGTIMHMAQRNNTLGAAINLSAFASWPVVNPQGTPITAEQALIKCLGFGVPGRHSDPHIGAQINALVRAGKDVTFADPPGLYIDSIDLSEFETPDGRPPEQLMRITRGANGFTMRVVFEAPVGSGFLLGDVMISNKKIRFGGQVAEKLRIRIRGGTRRSTALPPNLVCNTAPGAVMVAAAVPATASAVVPATLAGRANTRAFRDKEAVSPE